MIPGQIIVSNLTNNSKHFKQEIFKELEKDIENFASKRSIPLSGDYNTRTGMTVRQ